MGPTFAVLPVKRFDDAKQRLAGTFSADRHVELVAAMVADVLAALGSVRGLAGTIVVTAEPRAEALARAVGADVVPEPDSGGHSAAAMRGMAHARGRGAERALCVPGDCPALDPAEVEQLLADERPAPRVILVSDRCHIGTNALLLTPPGAIEPAFGAASRYRHEVRAREAGARYSARSLPSLELDVDTRSDLGALRRWLDARPGVAPRTRALLLAEGDGAPVPPDDADPLPGQADALPDDADALPA